MNKSKIKKVGQEVIKLESIALAKLAKSLDKDFIKAVELISQQNGKIIVSGVGKSGNIAGKIAASFTSTGIPAIYLNPVDASHGDMGIIEKNDVLTFSVQSKVANHCGVYLGNDVFYHHAENRLSCRENLYPFWVQSIDKVYRVNKYVT